ncbi:MAG: hypothetical protein EOO04_30155 [Chitinophagaceae bacterium]|nr:MAG: hypothetical protein EOO04_30155 [Chitinophagaceae bacterium]
MAIPPIFQTKHFDDFKFEQRLLPWQEQERYERIWQTTDIVNLQFTASFSPITVQLLDENDDIVLALPALVGLPNIYVPGAYLFSVNMSLATVNTGCYHFRIIAGPAGPTQKTYTSGCHYVSQDPIPQSILIEYFHSMYHEDVIFETGIKFQCRMFGHIGFLDPGRNDEFFRDQRYNPGLLNSRTVRQWPVFFGNEFGLADDDIDLLNRIWSCDNVFLDNKAFGVSDNSKFEFTEEEYFPKRGVTITVEEGINRASKIFALNLDTSKKIMASVNVESTVFGDTSNSGSSNTVPVHNITVE